MYKDHRRKVHEKHDARKQSMQLQYYHSLHEGAKQLRKELTDIEQCM